jgi:hypothetical protein
MIHIAFSQAAFDAIAATTPQAPPARTPASISRPVGSPLIGGGQNALGVPPTDTTGAPYKYDVGASAH